MTSPTTAGQPVAWMVEFQNGVIELWLASEINGVPAFGEIVTPLYEHPPTTPRVSP
jgi:hypothetical protein